MISFLFFIAACAAIVLGAWIVSKLTGSRAWYIEDWKYNNGETIIWRDDAADVGIIPKLGQAVVMHMPRLHRWPVVVTNQRIIIGNKTFTGRQMVKYVLYPCVSPDEQSKRDDGGLLTRGYATLVVRPETMTKHLDAQPKREYVALRPAAAEPSSFNLSEVRIYTETVATFRMP